MFERYGDIWEAAIEDEANAVIITTNGYITKGGLAVMGRGIALEAKTMYPEFPKMLGHWIGKRGNVPIFFTFTAPDAKIRHILTLPVKPAYGPNGEMGWKAKAEIPLIEESLIKLLKIINGLPEWSNWIKIYMPRPGCGNGGLKWEDVKPVIEPYLDDRFTVFHKN